MTARVAFLPPRLPPMTAATAAAVGGDLAPHSRERWEMDDGGGGISDVHLHSYGPGPARRNEGDGVEDLAGRGGFGGRGAGGRGGFHGDVPVGACDGRGGGRFGPAEGAEGAA